MIKRALLTIVLASSACTPAAEQPPPASLPDEAPPARARSVPQASEQVKAAEQKLQANDAAGAKELLTQALAARPDDTRALLDLGIASEMLEDLAGAKAAYRQGDRAAGDLAEALNNLACCCGTKAS